MRLRAIHLRRLGACDTTQFRGVFPKGAPLTARSIRLAKAGGLGSDLNWLRDTIKEPRNLCPIYCRLCEGEKRRYAWLVKSGLAAPLKRLLKGVR